MSIRALLSRSIGSRFTAEAMICKADARAPAGPDDQIDDLLVDAAFAAGAAHRVKTIA
jgi:hypothetical protein